ncbi:MAG: ATP-binding protein [Patescibacteria group bacterium]
MEITHELLSIQNPWWKKISLELDPVIEAYNNQVIKWQPKVLTKLEIDKDKIHLWQGPRGVGKTTAIKLFIKELINKRNINPENIFYYSCHNIDTYEQLNELIKTFLNHQSSQNKKRVFIFIDEVTLVKDWVKGIDFLARAGKLKNVTLFLAGSSLLSEQYKKIRSLPVKVDCKIITSLNFSEFVSLVNPAIIKKIKLNNYLKYKNQLDYYLDIYFLTGGFLASINSFFERGAVSQRIYSNYLYWQIADLAKIGRDIFLMRQILEQVLLKLGRPVGYKTIARKTKAKTHLTVAEYLNILESMFALKLIYQIGPTKELAKSRAKKVYFRDPFLFWLFYSYIHGSLNYWQFSRERLHQPEIFSALVENVIFSHLIKAETLENWGERVNYWRDNIRKTEINFLVKQKNKNLPILIRYQKKISLIDKKIFKQAGFTGGIIISQEELNLNSKIKIIPLTYFLLFYNN